MIIIKREPETDSEGENSDNKLRKYQGQGGAKRPHGPRQQASSRAHPAPTAGLYQDAMADIDAHPTHFNGPERADRATGPPDAAVLKRVRTSASVNSSTRVFSFEQKT